MDDPTPVHTDAPFALPARKRRVALIGNCQMQAMTNLYKKFVAGGTGDILTPVPSYEDLTEDGRATIEQADLVVEQLFDMKPVPVASVATDQWGSSVVRLEFRPRSWEPIKKLVPESNDDRPLGLALFGLTRLG